MKKTTYYVILAVIILLIAGAFVLYQRNTNNTQVSPEATAPQTGADSLEPTSQPAAEQPAAEPANSGGETAKSGEDIITKTDAGYSPSSITVKNGETVTWKNQSAQPTWPASAMHPTHTVYGGTTLSEHCPDTANTSFDACQGVASGGSWSFTFDKAGAWKYHDHLNPSHFGTVNVE